ncbi:kinesin-like protein, putative [Plasmodium ovale]|uniref:Kinesin-like protein n=1 Tax=Plasmodium ovale TaxID=36330 RepID=A0A1D3TIM8_PLAOA|nr:kinesin-like protein, putative [Plasmodium ovale]
MNENIKVFLRIKPNVENFSKLKNEDCAVYKINSNQLHLFEKKKSYNDSSEVQTKTFHFNHIFDVDIKQSDIFELIGKQLINNFINGYNSSILAYGNTNSGKTYTLYGDRTSTQEKKNNGLIYFSLHYFFQLQNANKSTKISVSVVEIYLEKIRDLGKIFELSQLSTTTDDMINYYSEFHDNIIREDEKGNTYVENVTLLPIRNIDDVVHIINLCFKYRKTYATKKNLVSSRSHCLLTVYQHRFVKEKELISQINFIDLAGSEKFNDIEMVNKKELININNTLSVLNRVIIALSTKNRIEKKIEKKNEIEKLKNDDDHPFAVHIPYRDSKLTRLLKNSLNGNSFTYILICLNLNSHKIEDFINSLIFAKRCKMIKQKIKKKKIEEYSANSENVKSNSSDEFSYESLNSNSEHFQFLTEQNMYNDTDIFEKDMYNKRRNKQNMLNHYTDKIVNKLVPLFTYIVRKRYKELLNEKRSILNNFIKVVKCQEYNKDELKKNKNYLLKFLKKKKKNLYKNKKILNDLIYSMEKEQKMVLQKNSNLKNYNSIYIEKKEMNILSSNVQDFFPSDICQNVVTCSSSFTKGKEGHLDNTKEGATETENSKLRTQIYEDVCTEDAITPEGSPFPTINVRSLDEKKLKDNTPSCLADGASSIYNNLRKNTDGIDKVYSDIDILFKIELNNLNEKMKTILKLNFVSVSLFRNLETVTKILKNVYQNKYNIVVKNGKKSLQIPHYNYDNFKKAYDINIGIMGIEQRSIINENNSLKNINPNILFLYQKMNNKKKVQNA